MSLRDCPEFWFSPTLPGGRSPASPAPLPPPPLSSTLFPLISGYLPFQRVTWERMAPPPRVSDATESVAVRTHHAEKSASENGSGSAERNRPLCELASGHQLCNLIGRGGVWAERSSVQESQRAVWLPPIGWCVWCVPATLTLCLL